MVVEALAMGGNSFLLQPVILEVEAVTSLPVSSAETLAMSGIFPVLQLVLSGTTVLLEVAP